jgi:hypothetical protein
LKPGDGGGPIWPRSHRRWPGSGRDLAGSGRDLARDDQDPASLSTGPLLLWAAVAGEGGGVTVCAGFVDIFLDLFWLLVYESWIFLHVPFISYEQNRRTLSMDLVLCMDVVLFVVHPS